MKYIRALIDADVLIPHILGDLILTAAVARAYKPIISESILNEVERNNPSAASRLNAIRNFFGDELVTTVEFDHIEISLPGNTKDEHVVKAAVAFQAQVIVTNDRKLTKQVNLDPRLAVTCISPWEFLSLLAYRHPREIDRAFHSIEQRTNASTPRTKEFVLSQIASEYVEWNQEFISLVSASMPDPNIVERIETRLSEIQSKFSN